MVPLHYCKSNFDYCRHTPGLVNCLLKGYWLMFFIRVFSGLILLLIFSACLTISTPTAAQLTESPPPSQTVDYQFEPTPTTVYLPLVTRPTVVPYDGATSFRVNVPFFEEDIRFPQTGIFWYGRVTSTDNYTDVRMGYTLSELVVYVSVFDRKLWYANNPNQTELEDWDAVTLYLNLEGNQGALPTSTAYRLVAQLNHWEPRDAYQRGYQGNGDSWSVSPLNFTSVSGWRGEGLNNDAEARGWNMEFRIPFTSLGLAAPPPDGTTWGLAVVTHDRDTPAGPPNLPQFWPTGMDAGQPETWGQLRFGLPVYMPPPVPSVNSTTIRHGLNGNEVIDAAVGGTVDNLCPGDIDYIWNQWGEANFAGAPHMNIQNQRNVDDWPCFARYYVTFPLDGLPIDKVILNAEVVMHQFGGSDPSLAHRSYIQVFRVDHPWQEATINWNNAPYALENLGGIWVDPTAFPGWPGIPYTWDVTGAVAQVVANGEMHLHLVFYSADGAMHSGKHFVTSNFAEDWPEGQISRPTLVVNWGNP
jgi:hypothetical protein